MLCSHSLVGFRQSFAIVCVLLAGMTCNSTASAQGRYSPTSGYNWTSFGAVDALGMRAYGQAELVRANGEAAVNFAEARIRHSEAYRNELQNHVEQVRAYWTRRAIGQEEQLKLKHDPLKDARRGNSKSWELLKDHPGASQAHLVHGDELNWLLRRMSANVLAYSYSQNYIEGAAGQHQDMKLSPEVLHALRLKQNRVGTQELVFRADEGTALQVDWWPWVLRASEFDLYRDAVETQRSKLQREMLDDKLTRESLAGMERAVVSLSRRLRLSAPAKAPYPEWSRHRQAADFVDSLYGEVRAMQDLGSPKSLNGKLRFQPDRDGDDLISLLRFMWRNGLVFASATPDDEPAYQRVFAMMRDLYANVADSDTGIQDDPNYLRLTPSKY